MTPGGSQRQTTLIKTLPTYDQKQQCEAHAKVITELSAGQTAMQSLRCGRRRLWFRDCRLRHMGTYPATLY